MAEVQKYLFTSESVTEGHPDKIADQISDAVLDAVLEQDPYGRVACEVLVTTGICVVSGEITTTCYVDVPRIAREVIRDIGYTDVADHFARNARHVHVTGRRDLARNDANAGSDEHFAGYSPIRVLFKDRVENGVGY